MYWIIAQFLGSISARTPKTPFLLKDISDKTQFYRLKIDPFFKWWRLSIYQIGFELKTFFWFELLPGNWDWHHYTLPSFSLFGGSFQIKWIIPAKICNSIDTIEVKFIRLNFITKFLIVLKCWPVNCIDITRETPKTSFRWGMFLKKKTIIMANIWCYFDKIKFKNTSYRAQNDHKYFFVLNFRSVGGIDITTHSQCFFSEGFFRWRSSIKAYNWFYM